MAEAKERHHGSAQRFRLADLRGVDGGGPNSRAQGGVLSDQVPSKGNEHGGDVFGNGAFVVERVGADSSGRQRTGLDAVIARTRHMNQTDVRRNRAHGFREPRSHVDVGVLEVREDRVFVPTVVPGCGCPVR